jgi:predicted MPP superfamily phosphohydrolase
VIKFMRHIVIGDVHGCIDELNDLIQKIEFQANDQLYFIGDLIDRGPDSAGVIKKIKTLASKYSLILILGNHEEKFLRYLHHSSANKSIVAQMKGTERFDALNSRLDQSDIEFLKSAFINYNIPGENICLLHGGIPATIGIDLSVNHPYSYEYGIVDYVCLCDGSLNLIKFQNN